LIVKLLLRTRDLAPVVLVDTSQLLEEELNCKGSAEEVTTLGTAWKAI